MKITIILLFLGFFSLVNQGWADTVETTSGTVYQGIIIKMDENELVIKTATGIARVPRSKVKSFQSGPLSETPSAKGTPSVTQPTVIKEEPSSKLGESAKEAVRALKKLEARCQVGISYKDYGPTLGDAKFEVNLFLDSKEAKEKPALAESIKKVMDHYEVAGIIWQKEFSRGSKFITLRPDEDPTGYFEAIVKLYPKAKDSGAIRSQGPIRQARTGSYQYYLGGDYIVIEKFLPVIWEEASNELKKATSLLPE